MRTPELDRIRLEYNKAYRGFGSDINHPWHPLNPISIYYRQAQERIISQILRNLSLDQNNCICLDIGCGFGGFLRFLASAGFINRNIHGIDIMPGRLVNAKYLVPSNLNLLLCDASNLPYKDASFNLVSQFTVISSIFDPSLRAKVCQEMQRVLYPKGYLIWYDLYRTRSKSTKSVLLHEVKMYFPDLRILRIYRMHSLISGKVAQFSQIMCNLLDKIPGLPKTHFLILFQKVDAGE